MGLFKRKEKDKTPKKRKNVSQTIRNGTLIITNDKYLYGTDGKSDKTRMSVVLDSNRQNELGLSKWTKSTKNGRKIKNSKGFLRHGNEIFTRDNDGKPIIVDGQKFIKGSKNRKISEGKANEIKRRNLKESKYNKRNRSNLRNLKKRNKKRDNKMSL